MKLSDESWMNCSNENKTYIWPALIIAIGLITAVFLYRYMDSFNTCVRALVVESSPNFTVADHVEHCAKITGD